MMSKEADSLQCFQLNFISAPVRPASHIRQQSGTQASSREDSCQARGTERQPWSHAPRERPQGASRRTRARPPACLASSTPVPRARAACEPVSVCRPAEWGAGAGGAGARRACLRISCSSSNWSGVSVGWPASTKQPGLQGPCPPGVSPPTQFLTPPTSANV